MTPGLRVAKSRPKENARRAREGLYRQLILEAAERSFAEKGFDDARIEEIAAESGLSLGTLYSVFAGKPDVMRAVLQGYQGRYGALKDAVTETEPTFDDAQLVFRDFVSLKARACVLETLGPEQAADMVGAERWVQP